MTMTDRRPTMSDLDVQFFALRVGVGGAFLGVILVIAIWLLPFLVTLVFVTASPTAAGLALNWYAKRWWRNRSVSEQEDQ